MLRLQFATQIKGNIIGLRKIGLAMPDIDTWNTDIILERQHHIKGAYSTEGFAISET
jgi:hypothetical protein